MGWLDDFLSPTDSGRKVNLPSIDLRGMRSPVVKGARSPFKPGHQPQELPNASLIYGIGAAALLAFALYSFFTGAWFTAFLLLFPAAALFGFALHYLKHAS